LNYIHYMYVLFKYHTVHQTFKLLIRLPIKPYKHKHIRLDPCEIKSVSFLSPTLHKSFTKS